MLRNLVIMAAVTAFSAAVPAFATPEAILPSRADVVGVAANDQLNIRSQPNAKSDVVGTLAPDAKGFEITGFDPSGSWARVSMGEASGWVSGRFVQLKNDTWALGQVPSTLSCYGTEPFWNLKRSASGMTFSTPDQEPRQLELRVVMDRGLPEDPMRSLIAGDGKGRVTAVIQPQQCSDGMSDREFGLAATVIMDGQGQKSRMLTGCCSVAAR